ncbi:MAG TPA: type II CAAX endopeptidase family protein [Methanocella sp.]|nr:type II CAAX endopeptidase family protein [Methanocella sp.]
MPESNRQQSDDSEDQWGVAFRVAIALIISFVVIAVVSIIAAFCWLFLVRALQSPVSADNSSLRQLLLTILYVLPDCALFMLAGYFTAGLDLKKAFIEDLGLKVDTKAVRSLALGLIIGLGSAAILNLAYLLTGQAMADTRSAQSLWLDISHAAPTLLVELFLILASSIAYETYFHGYVQRTLTNRYASFWGIATASVLCGLFALFPGPRTLSLSFVVLIFFYTISGYLYYMTRSLFLTIGFVFSHNFINSALNSTVILLFNLGSPDHSVNPDLIDAIKVIVYAALLCLIYGYYQVESEKPGRAKEIFQGALDRMTGSERRP